jgi:acyl-CoA thioesterase FadM
MYRRRVQPSPTHLFSPVTTSSRSSTYECDLNGHKSNSTYFSDLDIARTHLMCHLTKPSFALRRSRNQPQMYVALAGVTALFRKEIKPFQKYAVSSRILGWDGKWVFVVSHFTGGKDRDGNTVIFASCLSKYVFKSDRRTVPPEIVLRESGLIPERPEGAGEVEVSGASSGVGTPAGLQETRMGENRLEDAVARMTRVDRVKEDAERQAAMETDAKEEGYWTWERIEEERKRGLELAKHMLMLDGLVEEFRDGTEEGHESVGPFFGCW